MSLDLARVAAAAAMAKSDEQVVILEVGELLGITDYFVIASGRSKRQVKAIVDEITTRVRANGSRPVRSVEGLEDANWVLLDYGSFVVHVFDEETRGYYDLERLWADAPRIEHDGTLVGKSVPT